MEPLTERIRTRRLRVLGWVALTGVTLFTAGVIVFVRGVDRELNESLATPGSPYAMPSVPPTATFPMVPLGMLALCGGAGVLLGTLISWCLIRKPQFRLRSYFIALAVLAALLVSVPYAVHRAKEAGAGIHDNAMTIVRHGDGLGGSPSMVEMEFPLNNPFWLVLILLPAGTVILFAHWIYRR